MDIIITGRHIDITDPIRQYALDKTGKLPRYFDRVTEIEVVADKSDNRGYSAEIIVHVEHHDNFVAHATGDDLYACIDDATEKMERQLTDHKEKLRNRKHTASQ